MTCFAPCISLCFLAKPHLSPGVHDLFSVCSPVLGSIRTVMMALSTVLLAGLRVLRTGSSSMSAVSAAGAAGSPAGQRGTVLSTDRILDELWGDGHGRQAELALGLVSGLAAPWSPTVQNSQRAVSCYQKSWLVAAVRPGDIDSGRFERASQRRASQPRPIRPLPRRRCGRGWPGRGSRLRGVRVRGLAQAESLVSKSSAWRPPRCASKPICGWGCRARSSRN